MSTEGGGGPDELRERLARSEARLAEAQRIAHVGSWEWDVVENRVRWSDELFQIYGIDPKKFAGTYEGFIAHVLPEDRAHTSAVIFDAFRSPKPFVYDHRIVRADGEVRMLHTRGDVISDDHGKVVRMAGACWDTTDLWKATGELQQSVSLLKATFESTADGLLVVDRDGKVAAYNRRLLALWGLEEDDVRGRDFAQLLALVDPQLENAEACARRVREMESRLDGESFDSLRFLDGRFFERYSRPQRVGDQVVGRVWSYRDVTERERLLRGALFLSDASRLLATVEVERALDGVAQLALTWWCDACAVDLAVDGNPCRLLLRARDPAKGKAIEAPLVPGRSGPALFSVGSISCISVPLLSRGERLGALAFVAPGERRYSEPDLQLAIDLAVRVELALANARLYRQAREALAARDEFLSVAAHEIRGPLTSLRLAVQSLQKGPPPEVAVTMLSVIDREDRRIARFVDELLDVSRIRSGQLEYVFAPVDLVEVAREAAARLAPQLASAGSPLQIVTPATLVGSWDRGRLDQVVTNLLSNAVKFGLGKPIELAVTGDEKTAKVVVSDGGIGVPEEARERIFAPFERAISGRHYGGLGLGLYIVRTVLDGMGGTVRVEDNAGGGSRFIVEIPRQRRP
jgi:PAS domain S-box-containing protein